MRHILVHELLHCHTAGVQHHAVHEKFVALLGRPAWEAWFLGYQQLLENAIEGIAHALAPGLALVDWADKRTYRR